MLVQLQVNLVPSGFLWRQSKLINGDDCPWEKKKILISLTSLTTMAVVLETYEKAMWM